MDGWCETRRWVVGRGLRGLMDKASDFGSEDCGFESRRGRLLVPPSWPPVSPHTRHQRRPLQITSLPPLHNHNTLLTHNQHSTTGTSQMSLVSSVHTRTIVVSVRHQLPKTAHTHAQFHALTHSLSQTHRHTHTHARAHAQHLTPVHRSVFTMICCQKTRHHWSSWCVDADTTPIDSNTVMHGQPLNDAQVTLRMSTYLQGLNGVCRLVWGIRIRIYSWAVGLGTRVRVRITD